MGTTYVDNDLRAMLDKVEDSHLREEIEAHIKAKYVPRQLTDSFWQEETQQQIDKAMLAMLEEGQRYLDSTPDAKLTEVKSLLFSIFSGKYAERIKQLHRLPPSPPASQIIYMRDQIIQPDADSLTINN
ncbi:MAG: hypothetical protein HUK03_09855 [Bacteroidaceae bacterium]|nr:hypothetical protein [Bacteroidaceae bacterium]